MINIINKLLSRSNIRVLNTSLRRGFDAWKDCALISSSIPSQPIFDVGANIGQTYREIRRHFQSAPIHCFEPTQSAYDQLLQATQGDANVVCTRKACGSKSGTAALYHRDCTQLNSLRIENNTAANSPERTAEQVTITTIDDYCAANNINRIGILKSDTEGFDLEVIKGAQNCLANGSISFILSEVWFSPSDSQHTYFPDLHEYVSKYGFFLYSFYDMPLYCADLKSGFTNALFVHLSLSQSKP
jgi:FkbM family methyltransferase